MWNLWTMATKYSQRPSEVFGESDSIAAWNLDRAVTWLGITIENALADRVKVQLGSGFESRPKYTLARLLSPHFYLPRPIEEMHPTDPWAGLRMWFGKPGGLVKRFQYQKPVD
jgi:hypothetical protein